MLGLPGAMAGLGLTVMVKGAAELVQALAVVTVMVAL
jgi:hypothetical protein